MSYQNTLGWKQNNYGNLRGANVAWQGKIGMANGFAVFDTPVNGVRAIYVDLGVKLSKGVNTIEKIVDMYAPDFENDTERYKTVLVSLSGYPRNKVLTRNELIKLVPAIVKHEIGYSLPQALNLQAFALSDSSLKKKVK